VGTLKLTLIIFLVGLLGTTGVIVVASIDGRKWGPDSPFDPANPPGSPGGVVTYSFIPQGVDLGFDEGPSVDIRTLLPCAEAETRRALNVWQIANITFQQVPDPGDIRIGAHFIASGYSAHAWPPPLSGEQNSLLGDIHISTKYTWTCQDIYQIIQHEAGHALGLDHTDQKSVMNPYQAFSLRSLQQYDIDTAQAIYGPTPRKITLWLPFIKGL
jgi:hypothetical protein